MPPIFASPLALSARPLLYGTALRALAVLGIAFGSSGCLELGLGGEDSSSSDGTTNPADEEIEVEAGSCNAWKVAYCDAVEACESFSSRDECEDDVGYIQCWDDAPFGECEVQINAALADGECEALPGAECTPEQMADRTAPYAACVAMHEEICEWEMYCGYDLSGNLDGCVLDRMTADPCEEYFAVWPGIEPCLEQLPVMACDEAVPVDCIAILRK